MTIAFKPTVSFSTMSASPIPVLSLMMPVLRPMMIEKEATLGFYTGKVSNECQSLAGSLLPDSVFPGTIDG